MAGGATFYVGSTRLLEVSRHQKPAAMRGRSATVIQGTPCCASVIGTHKCFQKGISSKKWFARRRSILSNTPPSAAVAAAALQQHLCNVRYDLIACTALRFQEMLSLNTWL